jgi:hypothetical protein
MSAAGWTMSRRPGCPLPKAQSVYRVSAMDEIGEALDQRLGQMFGRPHWTTG